MSSQYVKKIQKVKFEGSINYSSKLLRLKVKKKITSQGRMQILCL